jgi:hypothetical protein
MNVIIIGVLHRFFFVTFVSKSVEGAQSVNKSGLVLSNVPLLATFGIDCFNNSGSDVIAAVSFPSKSQITIW